MELFHLFRRLRHRVTVLLNLQVIILPALAILFDGYRPPKTYYILVPIMILGVALTGGVFDPPSTEGPQTVYGMPIALLGTLLGRNVGRLLRHLPVLQPQSY